jgi:hypothetical protein
MNHKYKINWKVSFLKSEMLIALSLQNAGLLCYVTWSPNKGKQLWEIFTNVVQRSNSISKCKN